MLWTKLISGYISPKQRSPSNDSQVPLGDLLIVREALIRLTKAPDAEADKLIVSLNAGRSRPLFLQTGFRTGGTWLWGRFRAHASVLAFCEPFNEALADLTLEGIKSLTAQNSGLKHPMLSAPYFQEYAELLEQGVPGMPGFQCQFGIESYFGQHAVRDDDVRAYLQSLIDYAAQHGKTPVLKFTRGLGRSGWLQEQFPESAQLLLIRNPLTQFWSGYHQAVYRGNFTFLMIPLFALSRINAPVPQVIIDKYEIPYIPFSEGVAACAGQYTELARQMTLEKVFGMFLVLYVISHALSVPYADLTIYQERMQIEKPYRGWVQEQIAVLGGVPVDLSDIKSDAAGDLGAIVKDPVGRKLVRYAEYVLADLEDEYPASVDFVRDLLARSTG